MKIEDLLVFGKQHIHSDHAKILLAELINKNPLELLNYLEEPVPQEIVDKYKKEVAQYLTFNGEEGLIIGA